MHHVSQHLLSGQAIVETGSTLILKENLNYTTAGLLSENFEKFRLGKNRKKPNQRAYDILKIKSPERAIAIANIVYSKRMGNGNEASGDGARFLGRGIIQLTGRNNYTAFNEDYPTLWGENINFLENPELLETLKYAVRSALWFWSVYCATISDKGMTEDVADEITNKINSGAKNKKKRWDKANDIYDMDEFKNICYNTDASLINERAKEPFKDEKKD